MAKEPIKPTEAELEILQALWALGPSTVRQVHDHLDGRTGYTTILKLMQIMLAKGILLRDAKGKTHVYRPAQPTENVRRHLVADLIDRAFGGSARKLIAAALGAKRATPEELREIRSLLDSASVNAKGEGKVEKDGAK